MTWRRDERWWEGGGRRSMDGQFENDLARIPARKDIRRNPRSGTINVRNNRSIHRRADGRLTECGRTTDRPAPHSIVSHRRYPDHITVSPIADRPSTIDGSKGNRPSRRGMRANFAKGGGDKRFFGIIIGRRRQFGRCRGRARGRAVVGERESVNGCRFEQVVPPPLPPSLRSAVERKEKGRDPNELEILLPLGRSSPSMLLSLSLSLSPAFNNRCPSLPSSLSLPVARRFGLT